MLVAVIAASLLSLAPTGVVGVPVATATPSTTPERPRLRCATTALLRASMTPANAAIGTSERPALPDVVDSAERPLRVHFDSAVVAPDRAALALAAVEEAWQLQVDGAGFPAPLGDDRGFDDDGGDARLDVYLAPIAPGVGALTVSGDDVDPDDGRAARAAFVRVNAGVDDDVLVVTLHHEFQHVVQFAVDALESPMWFESNAVAWELRARPDVVAWQDALPSFQHQPQAPLSTDSAAFAPFATDDGGLFEYGAALFSLYLDEHEGDGDGRLLRTLWESSAQPAPLTPATNDDVVDDVNEPDWLDGLRQQVAGDDAFRELVLDFAAWRALTGSLVVANDGPPAAWNLDGRAGLGVRALRLDALSGLERTTTMAEGPFPLGCATFGGTAPRQLDVPLRVEATSTLGHPLGIVAVVVRGVGSSRTATSVRSDINTTVALDVNVEAAADVVVAICDVADIDADAAPSFAPVTLRFAGREPPPAGEGEGEGEGEAPPLAPQEDCGDDASDAVDCGCACQQEPSSTAPAGDPQSMRRTVGTVGFFVGAFGFALRGWRVWRRRALYRGRDTRR